MKFSVEKLSFSYGAREVLKEISFESESGTVTALLGENGVGKSTLLKCLCGLFRGVRGCFLNGEDLSLMTERERARKVAFVPQEIIFSSGTVFDAVLAGRIPHMDFSAKTADLEAVEGVLERLGLSDLALRDERTLSGGERQKVAIARALVQEPEVLLLDEPTGNLDLKNQREICSLLRELANEGLCVVVSVHDLNLALSLADQFLFLKDGKIFSYGDANSVTEETVRAVYGVDVRLFEEGGKRRILF